MNLSPLDQWYCFQGTDWWLILLQFESHTKEIEEQSQLLKRELRLKGEDLKTKEKQIEDLVRVQTRQVRICQYVSGD